MMEPTLHLLHTLLSFFAVLSVIVFIHEFGHYIIAKWCGVKIETFSIGFGKELAGFNDRSGTRWKLSALPLGGYVKMFGDGSAASNADVDAIERMTPSERSVTFYDKPLYKKAAIVGAGPCFNFALTIGIFTWFIMTSGLPSIDPVVGGLMPNSPAQKAGLLAGDRIETINGERVNSFNDISYLISTSVENTPVQLDVMRSAEKLHMTLIPAMVEDDDGLGNKIKRPLIGIKSAEVKYQDVGLMAAIVESARRTEMLCAATLKVIGQMVTGKRDAHDLRGPIGIAQLSGQAADKDFHTVLWLVAMISANLGLANLLPIPVLDGGHLLFYAIEATIGRPLAQRVQEAGFRVGFALLAMLMAFTVFNDVRKLL